MGLVFAGGCILSGVDCGFSTTPVDAENLTTASAPAEASDGVMGPTGLVSFYRAFLSAGTGSYPSFCYRLLPEPKAIAVGPGGDIWVAGTFTSPLVFGDAPLVSTGGSDVFVARLDSSGAPRWSMHLGGEGHEECKGFALDAEGSAVIVYQPSPGARSVSVAKVDPRGNLIWQREVLPASDQDGFEIVQAATSDGGRGVLLVDSVDGTFRAGSSTLHAAGGNFLVRLDMNGDVQWSSKLRSGDVSAVDIATDGVGDSIVALTSNTGNNGRLEKFDRSGKRIWWTPVLISGQQNLDLVSLAADERGGILLSGKGGRFAARLPGMQPNASWVARLDSSGTALWQAPSDLGRVAFDRAGNALCASGGTVTKLDPSGALLWRWRAQVTGDVRVGAVTVDMTGRLLITGSYLGTYDFGEGPIDSGPRPALFVVALAR